MCNWFYLTDAREIANYADDTFIAGGTVAIKNSRWDLGRCTWPKNGVLIKAPMIVSPHHHCPLNDLNMSEIRTNPNTETQAGTLYEDPRSPSRCSPVQQQGCSCHHTTARKNWSKQVNIVVMECYYRSNPFDEKGVLLKEYRQGMCREWLE